MTRNACLAIEEFIANQSLSDYRTNFGLRLQIERLLEIAGEALRYAEELDSNLQERIPELRSVIGMRNRIVHGYDGIDSEMIWLTATYRTPELRARLDSMLTDDI